MSKPGRPDPDVASLLRDMQAARARLAHMQQNPRGGAIALRAFALCDEVERLCNEAAVSDDRERTQELLARSRGHLEELQKLLGLH